MSQKTWNTVVRQGELLFFRVEDFDTGSLEEVAAEDGYVVVGHSETGHNHVMLAERTKMFKPKDLPESLTRFLEVSEEDLLEHQRSFDTHEAIVFPPGKYRVHIRREYTPEGFRRVED